jgi:zinc/manganese transport system substrate-binding protein
LLNAAPRADRIVINAAEITGKKPGDNPHLWYDPPTAPAVARALADALSKTDPERRADDEGRLKRFLAALMPIQQKITALRTKYSGTAVTATEPVFGYVAAALGLTMRNERFQVSVMNDTEPSAKDIAAFEDDLKGRKVKALFYNRQVTGKLTQRLLGLARASRIPIVGVTETMPAGTTFQDWIMGELGDTERALAGPPS